MWYDYKCPKCGERADVMQSVKAPHPNCPKCKATMERVIAPVPTHFKCRGFYDTDYKKRT